MMAWLGQMPSGCLRFRPEHRDSLPAAVGDSPRSSPPCVKVVLGTAIRLWMSGFRGGGTQWMVLSAPVNNPGSAARHGGTGSGVDGADGAIRREVNDLGRV